MSVFKKNRAAYFEKMGTFTEVTITEDKVKFSLNYSSITMNLEEVPKLLADVMQLYAMAKPILDRKSLEATKKKLAGLAGEKDSDDSDEPIDLSDIPF